MGALAEKQTYLSPEDYFEMELTSEGKNEYWHGEIFDMSGASYHHNLIAMNVSSTLYSALKNSNCVVFSSDMKIQVDEDKHYTYPDISAVCGDIEFAKERDDIIENPILIIEVLSESTKDYDRGSKFTAYRTIRSLRDYILIDQYTCHVEYFHKDESERWVLKEFKQPGNTLEIRSVGVKLLLSDIYHRVTFSD